MKTIGLLGGMSWQSTVTYYRLINEAVADRLGGYHSARIVMVSVDFDNIEKLQSSGQWDAAGTLLAEEARRVEAAGADLLLVCTNTMHKVAVQIEQAIGIPLIHIADAAGESIRSAGLTTVGLLGTRFTMEEEFYRSRLEAGFDLTVLTPGSADRNEIDRIIYHELVRGIIRDESRERCLEIVDSLCARGAQGVIEGCTEIPLLLGTEEAVVPLFDTTTIHAHRAVDLALGSD